MEHFAEEKWQMPLALGTRSQLNNPQPDWNHWYIAAEQHGNKRLLSDITANVIAKKLKVKVGKRPTS